MRRCNAPSDDLRPSGEDPSRIAVIIDEAHSGIPDDGTYIKNVAAKRYGKRHTQCTTSRMSQAYCQGWSHTLPRPTRQSVLSGDTICLVSCARSDSGWGPMAVLYEGGLARHSHHQVTFHVFQNVGSGRSGGCGPGHSNLQQPRQPCIIPRHGNMRKTFFYRCASVDTPNKLWPDRRANCNM